GGRGLRVYVLVVDGARPDEVVSGLMPRLAALRAGGTNYPAARSLPVMETIPNHVMMATGVRPDRSGVPANAVYDRAEGVARELDRPADLRFPTVLSRLADAGRVTGSVLSKRYLHGIFGGQATHEWMPAPLLPVTGHAPDAATVDALIEMVDAHDPALVLTNLGDVDRSGHADPTGPLGVQATRRAALADTDLHIGRFLDHLVATGRWASSVVLVLADHSMDWSVPDRTVSLTPTFEADPLLAGRSVLVQNGGADLAYWLGGAADRPAAVERMRALAAATDGVLATHAPESLRLGPAAGDLVAHCRAGWRFTEPERVSNPIPGNHGHPATEPIPFFVGGGSRRVRRGATSSAAARTVDVAPTVGALFGLSEPAGGYDGASRVDAFV
ncbi:MAG: alkaline phosphatase family protein, partial [Actinomycetes bacterium]